MKNVIFKQGDVVKCPEIWENRLFTVEAVTGNEYLPTLFVKFKGYGNVPSNYCNFIQSITKLVDANKRPFKKLTVKILLKLVAKNNQEAIREFIIRKNSK